MLRVFDQRQSLLDEIVAFTEFIYRIVDKVAGHIVEAVREIVQFFSVVPVVVEHVVEKSESFFRGRCRRMRVSVSMCMNCAVSMSMRVAVTAVLVRMSMLVIVFVDLMLVVCRDDFTFVICTHFVPPFAVSYPFIVIEYVVFLKALQPHMGVIFIQEILV